MNEVDFIRLDRQGRLDAVRAHGEYLGSRAHGGHRVHLYRMDGFFCELWMRLGWQEVEWIEVARNQEILTEYVKLDLRGL
ncbi:MAG: hypothetical protein JNM49_06875 [Flavobacteriales bacterium]|nr:hypothetical protein [Flavobacteriales bacterium]